MPFSSCSPASSKVRPDPATSSFTVLETRTSPGAASAATTIAATARSITAPSPMTVTVEPGFTPPEKPASKRQDFVAVSRRNFIELCEQLTAEDEKVFEGLYRLLGLSINTRPMRPNADTTMETARVFLVDQRL